MTVPARLIDCARPQGPAHRWRDVSEKHANFIVNDQNGTASDVRRLGETVRDVVRSETGVELVFESRLRGRLVELGVGVN